MTIAQLTRRLRGAWNDIAASIDRMILKMALPALSAIVATASDAADRIIAKGIADASKAADLKSQVDNFEQDAVAAVQPLATKLANADPGEPTVDVQPLQASSSLANGIVGQAYSGAVTISGGIAPYSVNSAQPTANGLTVNADGTITGTPEAEGGTQFDITVTDGASPPASVELTAVVTVDPTV